MDILDNPNIKNNLVTSNFFNLPNNNQRFQIIVPLEENPKENLKEIFNKIITEEKINDGYYQLQNLFTLAQQTNYNQNTIIGLIIGIIDKKIKTIYDATHNEKGELDPINLPMYNQLWKSYKDFTEKIYQIINHYQHFLVEKKIKIGKITYDILSIIQICMFYNGIIGNNSDILSLVSEEISNMDKNNIEQLIDYIDSIRMFMIMENFTIIDKNKLINIIRNIMGKIHIINIMCLYMHQLMKSLTNKEAVLDETEYETVNAVNFERSTIRKIYKITTILSHYSEKEILLPCYSKFMQARIIDPKYDNLELDIEMVKRVSGIFGKDDSQKLINTITDIINSREVNQLIRDAEVKISSDEYKKLNINTKILSPIILTKNAWMIYNITDLELNYPLEMKCYLEIISKSYHSLYDDEYIIQWQPTMGCAQFEAQLGSKKVEITCNILQAMVLSYLNDHRETTISQFSKDTYLNRDLAEKVFASLFEENIIICRENNMPESVYMANIYNYTDKNKLDIRKSFLETFNVEVMNSEL